MRNFAGARHEMGAWRYWIIGTNQVLKSYEPLKLGSFVNYKEYGSSVPQIARITKIDDYGIEVATVVMNHIIPVVKYEEDM